jgi:sulfatase modifying factor 1
VSDTCCAPGRGSEERKSSDRSTGSVAFGRLTMPSSAPDTDGTAMVTIPEGTFRMGSQSPEAFPDDGEGPVREIRLSAFQIDRCAVSNEAFDRFVQHTGYITEAERFGWSFVFAGLATRAARREASRGRVDAAPWWLAVEGADWRHPHGPESDLDSLDQHPVTHVSWNDAQMYAGWRGVRLPTEAEWERASRGGLDQALFPWGDELTPDGEHRANIWQGTFPVKNTAEDGFRGTAPVDAFVSNGFGLFNTSGNVWEWVADWFSRDWHVPVRVDTRTDPVGPRSGTEKVMRGGSYLCHASYCNRYRCSGRTHNTPDTSTGHTGFRCAADLA